MIRTTQIVITTLVRIKKFAIDRLGVYAQRTGFTSVIVLMSPGLGDFITEKVNAAFVGSNIEIVAEREIASSSLEIAQEIFQTLPSGVTAIFGVGGGKALDVAKYISFLARIPYVAVPTALSNDGFCSPQSSFEVKGKRRSLPAIVPYGVVIDTDVCLHAPQVLWWSGIGDLASKITAAYDWKLRSKRWGRRWTISPYCSRMQPFFSCRLRRTRITRACGSLAPRLCLTVLLWRSAVRRDPQAEVSTCFRTRLT